MVRQSRIDEWPHFDKLASLRASLAKTWVKYMFDPDILRYVLQGILVDHHSAKGVNYQ